VDETTNPTIKLEIAKALRDLRDTSLSSNLLERLQDETIEWQIRWLLTESLEGLQENAMAPLRAMLENSNIDRRVIVGIAATLGTWGVKESIPCLREAIERHIVPPNFWQGNYCWIGYTWQRITRTLNSWGNNSVVPVLAKTFQECVSAQEESISSVKWHFDVQSIISAASEYKPEAIARHLLEMLRQPKWQSFQDDILRHLEALTSKSVVHELLALLAERRRYNLSESRCQWIVHAIGEVADDEQALRDLWKMMPATPNSNDEKKFTGAIYSALYSVSQRAKVRVSRDGQIEEL
jgi:hypothetical protein